MRADFDGHRDVWGPLLALQLRSWSEAFFKPVERLRESGLFRPVTVGVEPPAEKIEGSGRRFTGGAPEIHLLDPQPAAAERLRYFDIAAEEYVSAVGPFTGPVLTQVESILDRYLEPGARVLDVSCGPGDEAVRLAGVVPDGEVVAVDLSAPTLREAFRLAREHEANNTVFHQADAQALPEAWTGAFDALVCILSLHFYEDPGAAAEGFRRVLRPGGMAFLAEPGSPQLNELSAPLVRMANPAFVGYRSAVELCRLFEEAGFDSSWWTEVLPGVGVLVARREEAGP